MKSFGNIGNVNKISSITIFLIFLQRTIYLVRPSYTLKQLYQFTNKVLSQGRSQDFISEGEHFIGWPRGGSEERSSPRTPENFRKFAKFS